MQYCGIICVLICLIIYCRIKPNKNQFSLKPILIPSSSMRRSHWGLGRLHLRRFNINVSAIVKKKKIYSPSKLSTSRVSLSLLFLSLPLSVSPLIQTMNFRFTLKLITPTNAPSTLIYNRSLMRFKPIKTANPINRRGLRLESSFTTRLSKFFFTQKPFENGFL